MENKLSFKLEAFEGPLELMLTLIAKHKLNIYDISISELLTQYLEAIEQMKFADLDVASEFLEMAAHLVYIKTVSLLPRQEEAQVLKRELEGRLLEYKLCREVAGSLSTRFQGNNIFVRRAQKLEYDKTYKLFHDKEMLLKAYTLAIGKAKRKLPPPRTSFSGIVSRRMVSVTGRILFVLKKLYKTGEVPYDEFFQSADRSELVATFLAMLELMKSGRIIVNDQSTMVIFNRNLPTKHHRRIEV